MEFNKINDNTKSQTNLCQSNILEILVIIWVGKSMTVTYCEYHSTKDENIGCVTRVTGLTHWGWDKMAATFQMKFSNGIL